MHTHHLPPSYSETIAISAATPKPGFCERAWVQGGLLALLALLVYGNSFPGAFILDDIPIVQNNPLLQHLDLATILRSDYWHGSANSGLYRPLTILSLALNRFFLGEGAWGFHLINVLLHTAVTVLLWSTLRRWTFSPRMALWSALLFAVHPLHTEVVDVVVGRSELLAAFFLLTACSAVRAEGWQRIAITFGAFLLALLSKEHAITFVLLLPLLDAFAAQSWRVWQKEWRLYAGVALIALLWLVWRKYGVVSLLPAALPSPADTPLVFLSWSGRFVSGIVLQWLYLGKLLVPYELQIFYAQSELPVGFDHAVSLTGLLVLASAGGVIGLIVCGWRRKVNAALFAALYLVAFFPVSNILLPIGVTFAERLTYFPSVWFCCMIAGGVDQLCSRAGATRVGWGVLSLYLVILGGVCLSRNHDFAGEVQLYAAEVRQNPQDIKGWVNLAESLAVNGNHADAEAAYRQMLKLDAGFVYGLRSRALFLALTGQGAAARLAAERALEAIKAEPPVTAAFHLEALAEAFVLTGDAARALDLLDQSTAILQDPTRKRDVRGRALTALGRYAEAAAVFEQISKQREDGDVLYSYGLSLYNLGRLAEARARLEEAVQAAASADAWNLLGAVCARQGDWSAAARAMERAVAMEPDNQHYRDNLQQAVRRAGSQEN